LARQFRNENRRRPAFAVTSLAAPTDSNGYRVRLWKRELADEIGVDIEVHHLPPETSKWDTAVSGDDESGGLAVTGAADRLPFVGEIRATSSNSPDGI
jgi:Rhodopirellula transposase DDE domain